MHLFALAFAVQCLFPLFDTGSETFFGLSLVNRDAPSRDFSVAVTSADGRSTLPGKTLSLAGGSQRALLLSEILNGSPLPASGWVSVGSDASGCPMVLTAGNPETLTAADATSLLSTSIWLPHIEINTGFVELAHSETIMQLVNPNDVVATVNVQLFGLDAQPRGTVTVPVPARGSSMSRIADLFQSVLPNNGAGGKVFSGYIRLSSDRGIAAWEQQVSPLSRAVMRGRGATEMASTSLAIIPHFVLGGTYASTINLVNPGSSAIDLELSAHDDRGNVIDTIPVRLAPGEARRSSVGEFFRAVLLLKDVPVSGYVRIRERQGGAFQIVGNVEIRSEQQGGPRASMLYPITDVASTTWLLPFAVSSDGYFTGYAIVNPNEFLAVQTDVTIEVLDSSGTVRSKSTASLSPKNRVAAMIPAGVSTGYVRITSNFPVHVLGSIGSRDGATLDQLPAIP